MDENSAAYRKAYKHYMKSSQTLPTSTWSAFRVEEKVYKTRFPRPSLDRVLDLTQLGGSTRDENLAHAGWPHGYCDSGAVKEIRTLDGTVRAFKVLQVPGAHIFVVLDLRCRHLICTKL